MGDTRFSWEGKQKTNSRSVHFQGFQEFLVGRNLQIICFTKWKTISPLQSHCFTMHGGMTRRRKLDSTLRMSSSILLLWFRKLGSGPAISIKVVLVSIKQINCLNPFVIMGSVGSLPPSKLAKIKSSLLKKYRIFRKRKCIWKAWFHIMKEQILKCLSSSMKGNLKK